MVDDYNADKYKSKYSSSYEKEFYKQDSVNINKIKCINDNININGINSGDVNVGNKGQPVPEEEDLSTNVFAGYDDERYYEDEYSNIKCKGFDCIINNNNENRQETQITPSTLPIPPPPLIDENVYVVWSDGTPGNNDI